MQLLPIAESLMFRLLPKSKIVLISGVIKGDLGSALNLRAAAVNCTLFKAENSRSRESSVPGLVKNKYE
jgi:hypothetical protein